MVICSGHHFVITGFFKTLRNVVEKLNFNIKGYSHIFQTIIKLDRTSQLFNLTIMSLVIDEFAKVATTIKVESEKRKRGRSIS